MERYFSVERMVQGTEAIYKELVREKMGLGWVEGEGRGKMEKGKWRIEDEEAEVGRV